MTIDLTPAELREFAKVWESDDDAVLNAASARIEEFIREIDQDVLAILSSLALALADAMEERDEAIKAKNGLMQLVCPHCGIEDRELTDAELDACPAPDSDDPKITRAEWISRHNLADTMERIERYEATLKSPLLQAAIEQRDKALADLEAARETIRSATQRETYDTGYGYDHVEFCWLDGEMTTVEEEHLPAVRAAWEGR